MVLNVHSVPAHAQRGKGGHKEDPAAQARAAGKKKKAREIDDAYKAVLKPPKPTSPQNGVDDLVALLKATDSSSSVSLLRGEAIVKQRR